jgi:hypothetical protein
MPSPPAAFSPQEGEAIEEGVLAEPSHDIADEEDADLLASNRGGRLGLSHTLAMGGAR